MKKHMKEQKTPEKAAYFPPEINCIALDNEISLSLESPPVRDDETFGMNLNIHQNDPFRTHQA